MLVNEAFCVLVIEIPGPVVFRISPPELSPPTVVLLLPTTVKLPLVFVSRMPLLPPLADTLVSVTTSGVVLLDRVISTAIAPLVLIAPLVVVIVVVLSVANKPL